MNRSLEDQVDHGDGYTDWALSWTLVSLLFFIMTKTGLATIVPAVVTEQGPVTVWKWTNIANSLLHSFSTSTGTLLCLYLHPHMPANVVTSYSELAHCIVAFSNGYFFFDFFDMLIYHRRRSSYELMVHHIIVIACFSLSATTGYYLGYALVALLVEVNSIFLHWRQLLLIQKVPKYESLYRRVSFLNLLTFLLFRIAPFSWMTRWLTLNGHLIPFGVHLLGIVSMVGVIIMNGVLFIRLLRADLLNGDKTHSE